MRVSLVGTTVLAAAAITLIGVGPAGAQTDHFKVHESIDVAGDVFTCASGDITVTGGMISQFVEGTVDAQGIFHITGTIVPHHVTAQDAAGNTYTISGAGWFGLKATGDPENGGMPIVATDTEHFVVHSADGAVYAKVQSVEHLSPNGKVISFDFGACQPPPD
jgi:glutamate dehydrogenase/leucine dehydrogenase